MTGAGQFVTPYRYKHFAITVVARREMQPATSGRVTGLMYKELSFRSVSKPGRVTAPGFIFGAETERVMAAALAQLEQNRHPNIEKSTA
jgi:hypothetical protein